MTEEDVVAMPLSLDELLVLMRSLTTALESERTRQGAFWDKPSS